MILKILVFEVVFTFVLCKKSNSPEITSTAVLDVVFNIFMNSQTSLDLITLRSSSNINEILNQVSQKLSASNISLKIFDEKSQEKFKIPQRALFFYDTIKDLSLFFNNWGHLEALYSRDDLDLKYLFYVHEKFDHKLLKIWPPNFDVGHVGHFSYFLINQQRKIDLMTIEWWTEAD
jgi:hypothetical protein